MLPSGCEILDIAPYTTRQALVIGRRFVKRIEERFGKPIDAVIAEWRAIWDADQYSDRPSTDENIGWYAAMGAMGHGVGLGDFGILVNLPSLEDY